MRKADYEYYIDDDKIYIIDLNLGSVSVTNDAENVLSEINYNNDIIGKKVLYKDSESLWSEIVPTWDDDGKCIDVTFKSEEITICAISDLHGYLPEIKPCNILFIAGDILPLNIQTNYEKSRDWLNTVFSDWIKGLPVEKVYLVAGNHDFYFEYISRSKINELSVNTDCKLWYLDNEVAVYTSDCGKTYSIYGTPYCHKYGNWAFMRDDEWLKETFKLIPDEIDFLITHDAPYGLDYQDVPMDKIRSRNILEHCGSKPLTDRLTDIKFKWMFHGHIHSSDHSPYEHNGGKIVNVSLLDEEYSPKYEPFYITTSKNE